jgi:hypothetical protein
MFQSLDEVPTACTTIEEVGSTGVGALTVAFLILIIATIIFLLKGWSSMEQKRLATKIIIPRIVQSLQRSKSSKLTKNFPAATMCALPTFVVLLLWPISLCFLVKGGPPLLVAGSSSMPGLFLPSTCGYGIFFDWTFGLAVMPIGSSHSRFSSSSSALSPMLTPPPSALAWALSVRHSFRITR